MIPELSPDTALEPHYLAYLSSLREAGFSGDVQTDYATRLITATDNSVYQIVPRAVLFPRHRDDVSLALRIAHRPEHAGIKLSPRGGGTGTNGQSLCDGVIVDLSRYLREIVEVDLEHGSAWVQPGVVLDQLNAHLRPHGVFFAPNLSPSSRATIGGMINTDACGKGSRVYGKTSNHVLELEVVLSDGTVLSSHEISIDELERLKRDRGIVGRVHREVDEVVTRNRDEIDAQLPQLARFVTGYDLAHVYSDDRTRFNLNAVIAGSEGTLGLVTAARVRLTPLPAHRKLVAIRYGDFDAALRAANELVETNPGAIETIDDTIVELAKNDTIWDSVAHLVGGDDGVPLRAINLVEFESHDPTVVERKALELCRTLDAQVRGGAGPIGYTVAEAARDIAALWGLRKKGVGLLGATRADRRPVPFVEDTVVPPSRLADYIREFRELLDAYGLQYGMFGHVDVGCLHVRPALDLRDPGDERVMREISDRVCALVKKYGGVMWGEHGRGYRSEYTPEFFGPELYREMRKVKAAFDPTNRLNPGKIATPWGRSDRLVSVDAVKRGAYDRQIGAAAQNHYGSTIHCNGNGACFDWDPDHVMCPSSKVTRDRIHSPKGRAGIMREWLRLLATTSYDPAGPAEAGIAVWQGRDRAPDDFSHQVYDAMNGCLACKACATQCPINVDVPAFRSQFYHRYHSRYRRPLKDYALASLEIMAPWMSAGAGLTNVMTQSRWGAWLLRRGLGMVDTPRVARLSLPRALRRRRAPVYRPEVVRGLPDDDKARTVLLVQDPFTSFFDADVGIATYDLLSALGYSVFVLPYRENGKGLHVKGFLSRFSAVVAANCEWLREAASTGVALVGIDPALTLTYRDEYVEAMAGADLGFEVLMLPEWLATQADHLRARLGRRETVEGPPVRFFSHCTERTATPRSVGQWTAVFELFGIPVQCQETGCCGMCGVFGHEREHYDESRGVYDMSWASRVASAEGSVVTTGFSCRHQVARFGDRSARHPAQVLLDSLGQAPMRVP